ncbi:MAG: helix-turn-helix domain-containing protein [Rubripirellula sp.]|nr:helix-turn-helix domain-containing protein [Rubripirellula sp.]
MPKSQIVPQNQTPSKDSLLFRSGDPDFMNSLARGLEVLRAFSGTDGHRTAAQISKHTGLSRAVIRRCLYTLSEAGYVTKIGNHYHLEAKVLSLAQPYYTAINSLPAIAQPFLEKVSQQINESCSLAVLDGDEVVYVARSATQRIMTVSLTIGSRLQSGCTSLGRVLLSNWSDQDLQSYLKRNPLTAHTEKTVTSNREWRKAISSVQKNNFALVDEELEIGLRSIAVPVTDASGRVIAAMNVGVQATRISKRVLQTEILATLRTQASGLSQRFSELEITS